MALGWAQVVHVLGLVLWTGGLALLTQLMIAASGESAAARSALVATANRLYRRAAMPGLVLSVASGVWMLHALGYRPLNAAEVGPAFHIKLTLVLALVATHFVALYQLSSLSQRSEPGGAGGYKVIHAIVVGLLVAILISVLVLYPYFRQKKIIERLDSPRSTAAAPAGPPGTALAESR